MSKRTYIRTYRAEVTETFTLTDADLTAEQIASLDGWWEEGRGDTLEVAAIFDDFDADHEDVGITDDQTVTVERVR